MKILRDPEFARHIGRLGKEHVRDNYLSPRELRDHLLLFAKLLGCKHSADERGNLERRRKNYRGLEQGPVTFSRNESGEREHSREPAASSPP